MAEYEVTVLQLVTPARELACIFDDQQDPSAVWLEPVYAMGLVLERIPDGKGNLVEQQAIVPICDYGTGDLFLAPTVEGYVGVISAVNTDLPRRVSARSDKRTWRRLEALVLRARERQVPAEGKVFDLVKAGLLRFAGGPPKPTAAKKAQIEHRAANLFVSAGRIIHDIRPDLRLQTAIDRVEKAFRSQK